MADASTHQTLYRYVPDGLTPRERTARRAEEIRDYYTAGHYRDLPGDVTSVEPAILALLAEIDASRAETEALRATAARQAGVVAAAEGLYDAYQRECVAHHAERDDWAYASSAAHTARQDAEDALFVLLCPEYDPEEWIPPALAALDAPGGGEGVEGDV